MHIHRLPSGVVTSDQATPASPQGPRAPHRRLRRADLLAAALPDWPGVWRADRCATPAQAGPTGHPALDAELPGGGWPAGGLVELLSAQPGLYEGALLSPHWVQLAQAQPAGRIAWVMPGQSPWRLHAPGVAHLGVPPQQLWCLQPATEADAAWAVEQMLHSGGITGIWWLTRHVQPQHLRRLQWAAQSRGIPLFASRPLASRQDPSPASLRLHLQAGSDQGLQVHILKRQGPRHEQPLHLPCPTPLHLLPRRPTRRPASAPASASTSALLQPARAHAGALRQTETAFSAGASHRPEWSKTSASQRHVVDRPVPAPVAD